VVDQSLILEFFRDTHLSQQLPNEVNWKGYWGGKKNVVIAHFHGPKPGRCVECYLIHRKSFWQQCDCPEAYKHIFSMVPDHGDYIEHLLNVYANFSAPIGNLNGVNNNARLPT
jgi:hypothetical protein